MNNKARAILTFLYLEANFITRRYKKQMKDLFAVTDNRRAVNKKRFPT